MYVCLCGDATILDIETAIAEGANTMGELQSKCAVATGCGMCEDEVREILERTSS